MGSKHTENNGERTQRTQGFQTLPHVERTQGFQTHPYVETSAEASQRRLGVPGFGKSTHDKKTWIPSCSIRGVSRPKLRIWHLGASKFRAFGIIFAVRSRPQIPGRTRSGWAAPMVCQGKQRQGEKGVVNSSCSELNPLLGNVIKSYTFQNYHCWSGLLQEFQPFLLFFQHFFLLLLLLVSQQLWPAPHLFEPVHCFSGDTD